MKKLLKLRNDFMEFIYSKSEQFLINNEKILKYFLYFWLFFIFLNIIYLLWIEFSWFKFYLFLMWIFLLFSILNYIKEFFFDFNETDNKLFRYYLLIFFWMNINYIFFFFWSNIIKPFLKKLINFFNISEIIGWDIRIIDKVLDYSLSLSFWNFIIIIIIFYLKIIYDAIFFDEELGITDRFYKIKNTKVYKYIYIYNYSKYIQYISWIFLGILRILNIHNIFTYIILIISFISGFIFLFFFFWIKKEEFINKKIW